MESIRDIRTVRQNKANKTLSVTIPGSKGFEAGQTVLVVVIDEYLDELTAVVVAESKVDKKKVLTKALDPELLEEVKTDKECWKCPLCGREHFFNLDILDKCKNCGSPKA